MLRCVVTALWSRIPVLLSCLGVVVAAPIAVRAQGAAPIVAVSPAYGTEVTTATTTLTATFCDPDNDIAQQTFTWQGAPLGAPTTTTTATLSGCTTATRYTWNVSIDPWDQTFEATATDQAGHVGSAWTRVRYLAPVALFRPELTPRGVARLAALNASVADTFFVRNAGQYPAGYYLTATCGSLSGCSVSPPVQSAAPGAVGRIVVAHQSASVTGQADTVRLVATFNSPSGSIADTAFVVSTVPTGTAAPLVTVSPAWGTEVTSLAGTVSATFCDRDEDIAQTHFTWHGGVLGAPDTIASVSAPGCFAAATRYTWVVTMDPWDQIFEATVTDQAGHVGSAWTRVRYLAPVALFRPEVSPRGDAHVAVLSAAVSDTFYVHNAGQYPAGYSLSSTCGGLPNCTVSPPEYGMAAGATGRVVVTHTSASVAGRADTVALIARFDSPSGALADTGYIVSTVPTGTAAPRVIVSPAFDTVVTSATTTLTATFCDRDEDIAQTHFTWQGATLGAPTTSERVAMAGCFALATRDSWTVLIDPWDQIFEATITDQAGHVGSAWTRVRYLAPVSLFRPEVSPRVGTHDVSLATMVADTFYVHNAGYYPAGYNLTATCGTLASCTVSPAQQSMEAGATGRVIVSHASSSIPDRADTITLVASFNSPSGALADTGRIVSMVPAGGLAPVVTIGPSLRTDPPTWIATFVGTVANPGPVAVTYALTSTMTGGYTFGPNMAAPDTVTVPAGESRWVYMFPKAPAAEGARGTVTFKASYVSPTGVTLATQATAEGVTQSPHAAVALRATQVSFPSATPWVSFGATNTGNSSMSVRFTVLECSGLAAHCRFEPAGAATSEASIGVGSAAGVQLDFDDNGQATGRITVQVADENAMSSAADAATIDLHRDGAFIALAVTPRAMVVPMNRGRAGSQRFYIRNTGTAVAGVTYAASCSPSICGATDKTSATIGAGGLDSVTIPFTTPATFGTDTVRLLATSASRADTGFVILAVDSIADVRVIARTIAAGANITRSQCLTIAAGDAAAYECGDLRLVHGLPATTTMNKTRAPALIYTSRHQTAIALFPADLSIAAGNTVTGLVGHVLLAPVTGDFVERGTKSFAWQPSWSGSGARRLVIPADASMLPTGAYRYRVAIDVNTATGPTQVSDTGTVAIVNRGNSWFGAGWWLDGLEQIVDYGTNQKLWVGGDGSTRLYTKTAVDGVWTVQPTLDRPDTLLVVGQFQYRHLRNGAYVKFDNTGRHRATVNAAGHVTAFNYNDGDPGHWNRLVSIDLPVPAGSTRQRTYTFVYGYPANSETYLSQVTPPASAQGSRAVSISHQSGTNQITRIGSPAPDASGVGFSIGGSGLIAARTDRRGFTTTFTYDSVAQTLRRSTLDMAGTAADNIVRTFCAAEAASVLACAADPIDVNAVHTWYDGPRSVGDTTRFYLTAYGAPRSIVDPLGRTTTIERNDASWPLLATGVIQPNSFTTRAAYNARALTMADTAKSPFGGGDAVTRYVWSDTSRFDRIESTVAPTGEVTRFGYFANGDRQWQEDGRGSMSRVSFSYNGNRQLITIQSPGNNTSQLDSLVYEDSLGNLSRATNALGVATVYHTDAIGRVDTVFTPITGALKRVQSSVFDVEDRVLVQKDSGPAVSYQVGSNVSGTAPAGTLRVENVYDLEGNVLSTTRSASPNPANQVPQQMTWVYDGAHRVRTASSMTGASDVTTYDAAGNAITATNRRGKVTRMSYDVLNRLTMRITDSVSYAPQAGTLPEVVRAPVKFPYYAPGFAYDWRANSGATPPPLVLWGDTATFTYDPQTGGMATANNTNAQITRTYYPGGALRTDDTHLAVVDSLQTPASSRFGVHQYTLSYAYDLSGRRTSRTDNVPGCSPSCTQTYAYDTQAGMLQSTWDGGARFDFAYDAAGRLASRTSFTSSGITAASEIMGYDPAGRMINRQVNGTGGGLVYGDVLTYDDANRVATASSSSGDLAYTVQNAYSGLGALSAMRRERNAVAAIDEYVTDAFGNAITHKARNATDGTSSTLEELQYNNEQQTASRHSPLNWAPGQTIPSDIMDTTERRFDIAGNLDATIRYVSKFMNPSWRGTIEGREWTWNAYGADDKLRVAQRSYYTDTVTQQTVVMEHRYDALGRRVLTRKRWDLYCSPSVVDDTCHPSVDRTIWDGDQVLMEMRNDNVRHVADTHPNCGPDDDHLTNPNCTQDAFLPYYTQDGADLETEYTSGSFAGRVRYTHAGGIDEPLAVWKSGIEVGIVPHRSWRGVYEAGSYLGASSVGLTWPGRNVDAFHAIDDRLAPIQATHWLGSVVDGRADPSGLTYMRNRFYDPRGGRFVQEDPIGLAGGMNLYGFVGGDPVNHSDPFGLCGKKGEAPCPKQEGPTIDQQKAVVNGIMKFNDAITSFFVFGALAEAGASAGISSGEAGVANPVPATLARVIPAGRLSVTLAPAEATEAFVTDAAAIRGMGYSELESGLGIAPSKSGYEVITFSTKAAGSIASPVSRTNRLFVGGGRTVGGLPEFVIPNIRIPADATRTVIKP